MADDGADIAKRAALAAAAETPAGWSVTLVLCRPRGEGLEIKLESQVATPAALARLLEMASAIPRAIPPRPPEPIH